MEKFGPTLMTRREVVRSLVISVGGSSLLSACGGRVTLDPLTPTAEPRFYSEREMAVLSRVSDLLIPRTETPGALDAGVPSLLDGLMSEWANDETKASHRRALGALDAALQAEVGGDVVDATDPVAGQALATVDAAAFADGGPQGYRNLKGLIAQAYFSTEPGALEEQQWVAVPGRWDPCADRT